MCNAFLGPICCRWFKPAWTVFHSICRRWWSQGCSVAVDEWTSEKRDASSSDSFVTFNWRTRSLYAIERSDLKEFRDGRLFVVYWLLSESFKYKMGSFNNQRLFRANTQTLVQVVFVCKALTMCEDMQRGMAPIHGRQWTVRLVPILMPQASFPQGGEN